MDRLLVLDSLRGIAAILVVVYHYTFRYRELYGHNFSSSFDFNYGYLGVELFFMISGFVIFLTINKIKCWQEFVFKRFSRLYPVYWLCLIITFITVTVLGLEGREVGLKEFFINFSMIQTLFRVSNVDGVYWSLFPELIFYGMMLTLYICNKTDKVIYFGGIWVLVSFLHLSIFKLPLVGVLLNLKYASLFYSGILFYLLKYSTVNRGLVAITLLLTMVGTVLTFEVEGGLTERVIVSGIYIVFYLFTIDKLNFLTYKPLLLLGSISYPLYLIHQNIGYIVINYTKSFFGESYFVILPPILISILAAYLITKYVEKPSLQIFRNWYNGYSLKKNWERTILQDDVLEKKELQNA